MTKLNRKEIQKYWQWLQEGKSPDDVRKDLLIHGTSEEDASIIIRSLDDLNLQRRWQSEISRKAKVFRLVGMIVLGISIANLVYAIFFTNLSIQSVLFLTAGISSGFATIAYANRLTSKGIFTTSRFSRKFSRKF